jgi:putative glutamine amidotransferase
MVHKPTARHEPYDHQRDNLTLDLIRSVLKRKMPLFCICRGFQELNVVFGGTLDTEVQDLPGSLDHRAPDSDDLAVRYGPAHPIAIEPGSLLHTDPEEVRHHGEYRSPPGRCQTGRRT